MFNCLTVDIALSPVDAIQFAHQQKEGYHDQVNHCVCTLNTLSFFSRVQKLKLIYGLPDRNRDAFLVVSDRLSEISFYFFGNITL